MVGFHKCPRGCTTEMKFLRIHTSGRQAHGAKVLVGTRVYSGPGWEGGSCPEGSGGQAASKRGRRPRELSVLTLYLDASAAIELAGHRGPGRNRPHTADFPWETTIRRLPRTSREPGVGEERAPGLEIFRMHY